MRDPYEPLDRWHKQYPKEGDEPCKCGSRQHPKYPTAEHGRGSQWLAPYRAPSDPPEKIRKPAYEHYDEAKKFLAETLTDIGRGAWVDPEAGKVLAVTLAEEWLGWIKKKHGVQNTVNTYTTHARVYIIPFLGRRTAGSLRRPDTNAFVDVLTEKLEREEISATYLQQVFKTWRIWVNWLVDEKEVPLPANVVQRIRLPEADEREPYDYTPEEVERLAAAIEPRYEIMVWMAACGGLREGEGFGMLKERIDFLRRRWFVKEQRQQGKAVKTKTKSSMAWVSVDAFLLGKIAAHLAAGYDKPEPVKHDTELRRQRRQARGEWAPPVDEGLIVTNPQGRPLRRSVFNKAWNEAKRKAGVGKDARFHDLKGFYSTTLARSRQHDPKTVQRLSRHSRFEETWDTYVRAGEEGEEVTVTAFTVAFVGDGAEAAAS
ncbi:MULTISPECIES: site-specific integrase [Streptomyces]|uniref:site-specific integrase n=1 Tax=Streptomyces TaxID=1883 RepID=UPI00345C2E5A